jgi:WD40 repeat protein
MPLLDDLTACFEDALPSAATAVCVGEHHAAAACAQSIAIYEMSPAAGGGSAPAFEKSLTLFTHGATKLLRLIDKSSLAAADDTQFIYIWALNNWQLAASGSQPGSVIMAGCCAAVLCGHDKNVTCLACNTGRMFSASSDGTICCWSTREFDCVFKSKCSAGVTALCCTDKVFCSADASKMVKVSLDLPAMKKCSIMKCSIMKCSIMK